MKLQLNYREDLKLIPTAWIGFWTACLVVALILIPFVAKSYLLYTINLIAVHVLVAIGLNLLMGYAGQISLGHAGFYAIGAYASTLLMTRMDWPFFPALIAAGAIAALIGFIVGLPALRLEGPYLAIASLGFGIAIVQILAQWKSVSGGHMGIAVPPMAIGPIELDTEWKRYAFIMPTTAALAIFAIHLTRSRVGRAWTAIRESDIAAQAMGVNLAYYKTLAFAVSAFYTGIAGSLMAHMTEYISPEGFHFLLSIEFMAMVVIGGLGSILGSIAGAILMTVLPQVLSAWKGLPNTAPMIAIGLILASIMLFEPLGLRGVWLRTKIYFLKWPF